MIFCESILDELKLNLRNPGNDGDLLARRMLEAVCRNRLVPTTWLNKVRPLAFLAITHMKCRLVASG